MIRNNTINNALKSPTRKIYCGVELYSESSTSLDYEFSSSDAIKSVQIERVGEEGKFFGFGFCQKAKLNLVDTKREINISTANDFNVTFGAGEEESYMNCLPQFYVKEVTRDENTNELTITAYDAIYEASNHTVSELNLEAPYTLLDVAEACGKLLGDLIVKVPTDGSFTLSYTTGANLDGTETIREILDDIAEATQTIYYICSDGNLTFKRLDIDGDSVLTIGKADYFTLDSKTTHTLASIVSATELGDNYGASLEIEGETQYIRDNPFIELREDIDTVVEEALDAIGGITITQFNCSWRGNFLLELGDKIDLVTKNDSTITSYILNDTISFTGGLAQKTSWGYEQSNETHSNPTSLGDVLKQTYAKVDKANKEIDIVAGEASSLRLTTENITAAVISTNNNVDELYAEVEAKMSAEDVSLSIQTALGEGAERVTTSTGFTFNEEGLHISKSDSEITTSITEDGMTVYKDSNEVLVADNLGVRAEDLHATTFLIVGKNSRFEDYNSNRTGCFWIGN